MKNHFEIFGLAPQFNINLMQLQHNFLRLQARCHPDQFNQATQSAQKKLAIQMSSTLNEAKTILENPAKRASYCIQLCGLDLINAKANIQMIQQQFIWQEQLFEARDLYLKNIQSDWQKLLQKLAIAFDALFQKIYAHQLGSNSFFHEVNEYNNQSDVDLLKTQAQNIILLFNFSKNW